MHDLLRLFAREQAQRQERPEARRAALRRVLHWYHATAQRANRLVQPANLRRGGDGEAGGAQFQDRAGAMAWLEEERKNLLAAARQAAKQPRPLAGVTVALADALFFFAQTRGYCRDWEELNQLAIQVRPEARGPHRGEQGAQRPRRGLLPFRPPPRGDRAPGAGAPDPSRPRRPRGRVGRPRQPDHRLPRVRAVGGGHRELRARAHDLPSVRLPLRRGDPRQHLGPRLPGPGPPRRRHRSAAGVAGDLRGPWRCIWARQFPRESRGGLPSGRPSEAVEFCERGLARFREVGDRSDEAEALARLGSALDALGDHEQARLRWREALDIFSAIGAPRAAEILTLLGEHPTTE